jgi:hypothetical protein
MVPTYVEEINTFKFEIWIRNMASKIYAWLKTKAVPTIVKYNKKYILYKSIISCSKQMMGGGENDIIGPFWLYIKEMFDIKSGKD